MDIREYVMRFNNIYLFYPCSIQLELPRPLFDPTFFNAWMVLFLNILERPVPVEGQPEDPELRKSWGWWKTKKWVAHILNRLYTRYAGSIKTYLLTYNLDTFFFICLQINCLEKPV